MLKIILTVLGLVALAAGALVAYAATQPGDFRVQRSLLIAAPPDKIQPLVNDFKAWGAWSPWEHKDPEMKRTYSEPSAGQGATYAWEGNSDVGAGEIVMAESTLQRIKLDMHFKAPFDARHTGEFTFVPEGNGTNVTWAMYGGDTPLMAKVIHVVMDMDKMVGAEFEKGLAAMKAKAEAR